VLILDKGRLKGSFRLEDLEGATGRFDVEADGDAASFERAVASSGFETVAAPAADDETGDAPSLAEDGLPRFRRIVRVGAPEPTTALLAVGRQAGVRVRRVAAVVEKLEDVFHRLLAGRGDVGAASGADVTVRRPTPTSAPHADGPDGRLFP